MHTALHLTSCYINSRCDCDAVWETWTFDLRSAWSHDLWSARTHTCTADASTSNTWAMQHGTPISWRKTWEELAWRFSRQYQPATTDATADAPAHATIAGTAVLAATPNGGTPHQPHATIARTVLPLNIENGVTGRNNLRKDKARATINVRRAKEVACMEQHLKKVCANDLVLVDVSDMKVVEGEMAIGLARALEDSDRNFCKLKWYIRKEWSRAQQHAWSANPMFEVAGDPTDPTRPYMSTEPLEKVLPIVIQLTGKSTNSEPRLTAECVRMAREVCAQRGLCRDPPTSTAQQQPLAVSRKRRLSGAALNSSDEESMEEESEGEEDAVDGEEDTEVSEGEEMCDSSD